MDILKLQKEKLIETTIINCNRNLFIYEELIKRLPELIDNNLNYWSKNDVESYEKIKLAGELLTRNGMATVVDKHHGEKINAVINFFSKTLKKMQEIERKLKIEIVETAGGRKALLKCENFLIKEFDYISPFQIIKELLEESNERDEALFIISACYINEDHSLILLAWYSHFLKKEDFIKLKKYRQTNPDKDSNNYIIDEAVQRTMKRLAEIKK